MTEIEKILREVRQDTKSLAEDESCDIFTKAQLTTMLWTLTKMEDLLRAKNNFLSRVRERKK